MDEMFNQLTSAIDERHRDFFAQSGDARQVWARDSDRGRVIYLREDGVDHQLRQACDEGRLCCPMSDCPDPRFVAKGGELRRHHFAHKVAHTKHAPAAVFRAEAVAMLADWARHFPSAEVATSDEGNLGRVAVRSTRTGKVVTLAITYDRSYPFWTDDDEPTAAGYDQLLVGHTRGLLLPRTEHSTQPDVWCCADPQLIRSIIIRQGAAIAVNPQRRLVATLMPSAAARSSGLIPMTLVGHPNVCIVEDLDACRLDETGLLTPAARTLRAWRARQAARRPAPSLSNTPAPATPTRAATRYYARQQEYLRRAQGLNTEQRLALIKEMFLANRREP